MPIAPGDAKVTRPDPAAGIASPTTGTTVTVAPGGDSPWAALVGCGVLLLCAVAGAGLGWCAGRWVGGAGWGIAGAIVGGVVVLGLVIFFGSRGDPAEGQGERDGEGKEHGLWTWRYRSGNRKIEAHFEHGTRQGVETHWSDGGQKQAEGSNQGGIAEGTWTYWHANGPKSAEGEMRSGVREGEWTHWDEGGKLQAKVTYRRGVEDGPAAFWHPGGERSAEGEYRNGKPHGPWRYWHSGGQPEMECTYADGLLHGPSVSWYPNGAKKSEAGYCHGTPHGTWTEWREDGGRRYTLQYVSGVPIARGFQRYRDPRQTGKTGVVGYLFWCAVVGMVTAAVLKDVYLVGGIVIFLLALTIHEAGHFIAAKLVGIPIQRFRIGIGPTLFRFVFRSTRYELGICPVMGFVQPYVMRPAELAHYYAARRALRKGQPLPPEPECAASEAAKPTSELVSRPRRLVFMLGGVTANYIAAVVLLWLEFTIAAHLARRPESLAQSGLRASKEVIRMTWIMATVIPQGLAEQFNPKRYTTYEAGALVQMGEVTRKQVAADQALRKLHEARAKSAPGDSQGLAPYPYAGTLRLGLAMLAVWNVGLFTLNLLPVPPLDGFRCARVTVEMLIRRDLPDRYVLPVVVVGGCLVLLLICSGIFFMGRDVVMTVFQ
jgi:antitoxin component YwqK of YwqJK toxin-antitoxin module/Zn-dependent protease